MTFEETAKSTVRDAMDQGRETAQKAGQAVKGAYEAAQQFAEDELSILTLATSFGANRG